MEINSHIYEYMQHHPGDGETQNLRMVLELLGAPETFLREIIAVKKTRQAIRTKNPGHLAQSIWLNLRRGVLYILLAIFYLMSFSFLVMAVLKPFFYNDIGCYVGKGSFHFGITDGLNGEREILGIWFIPVSLALALIFYGLIIYLLKLKNRKK